MEHTKHLWRAFLLLAIVALGGLSARHFLLPPSFGEHGFYRYQGLMELMNAEVVHGSVDACAECHSEIASSKANGIHATVSCETCHAPLATHATDSEKTAEMRVDRTHLLCALCHQKMKGRPDAFSQLDINEHVQMLEVVPIGESIPDGTCIVCHDPHGS